jgi:GntR family transcriptional regulator / MocR family aminotransferase
VALLGSVSKSLAPTLRLGWIVCPTGLVEAVAHSKHLDDRGSPGLDQLALAAMIRSGRYDRHLRRMRARYAARRGALLRALARHAPQVALGGLAAGFHAVAHLPDPAEEAAVVAAAQTRRIGLYGMSAYRSSNSAQPPQLVLGFGNLREAAIEGGITTVSDLLQANQ